MTARWTWLTALVVLSWPDGGQAADVGDIALVEDKTGDINGTIALPNVYLAKAACAFYAAHKDSFDAIFVFTTLPQNFLTNVQQGWPVKQQAKGIGRDGWLWDQTATFCSTGGKLRQAVKMGDLAILPDNPDALYTGIPFYPLSGIQLVAHEFGHHWMASIRFDKGDGKKHCLLRGYEPSGRGNTGECDGYQETDYNQHWSYYFNSGSLMYGSMITDLGGGKFKLYYDQPKYSPLDQYLMGLRVKADVPPQFLVDVGSSMTGSASIPLSPGKTDTVSGTRLDFTIDDVIRVEGPRQPASEPCHWTAAFIVVHAAGKPPSATEIAKLDQYRTRWESFYLWATEGRGSFDTTLDNRGKPACGAPVAPDATMPRDAAIAVDLGPRRDSSVADRPALTLDRPSADVAATPPASGCSCDLAGRSQGGAVLLLLFALVLVPVRRTRR